MLAAFNLPTRRLDAHNGRVTGQVYVSCNCFRVQYTSYSGVLVRAHHRITRRKTRFYNDAQGDLRTPGMCFSAIFLCSPLYLLCLRAAAGSVFEIFTFPEGLCLRFEQRNSGKRARHGKQSLPVVRVLRARLYYNGR